VLHLKLEPKHTEEEAVATMKNKMGKTMLAGLSAAFAGALMMATPAAAQQTITGESYEPTIWVDPDGCTH
jgi:hypothetical protein